MTRSRVEWPRVGTSLTLALFALVALLSWGLASPVGSSPDDDFHLASIWCAGGDREGLCELVDGDKGEVSEELVVGSVCFAYDPEKSAGCQGDRLGDDDGTVATGRGNFLGLYPPLFYLTMNLFASPDIETSVLVMRSVNAVLFIGVLGALFALLPAHRRGTLVASVVVTVVPLGMFIIPSTNPSSWAVLSAAALFLSLLGYVESRGRRRVALGIVAVIATVVGAGARADAALYAVIAIVAVGVLVIRRDRALLVTAILPAVLTLVAVGFYLTASQAEAISTGLESPESGRRDALTLALVNLVGVPDLWAGVFGTWGLGWLDTAMPAAVWVAGLLVFGVTVFLGLGLGVRRKGLATAWVFAMLVIAPILVLVRTGATVGAYVQPRYILPLMILLALVVLLRTRDDDRTLSRPQAALIVVALAAANSFALHTNIRRYVTGSDVVGVDLDSGREWWWAIPMTPMAVWVVGSVAFASALVVLARYPWGRREERQPAEVSAS